MNKPEISSPQMVACVAWLTIGGATAGLWAVCGGLYIAC